MTLRLVHSAAEHEPAPVPAGIPPRGFEVVSHRRLPGTGTLIRDIFVGPPGVFAVDRKRLLGDIAIEEGQALLNGKPRNALTEVSRRAAEALGRMLHVEFGDLGIPVVPVLCVDGARIPRRASVDGVRLLSSDSLERFLRRARSALAKSDVDTIANLFASRLPHASR